MSKAIGLLLVLIGLFGFVFIWYKSTGFDRVTRTFSPYTLLISSWEQYKQQFINDDGRVIDYSLNGITTSEGQSYALLRAVWVDDKQTFDLVWKWTSENLNRDDDNLFAWKWGKLPDGQYGFLQDGGDNSASDADIDIALSLIFASRRWGDDSYANAALLILEDIWNIETVEIGQDRYLIAGNWANGEEQVIVNPSYFAPYAWRIFSEVDEDRDWLSLIDPAYTLLSNSGDQMLNSKRGVGLPPDWLAIDKNSFQITSPEFANLTVNYSYDALRVPFRIALDYQWFGEERALEYLSRSFAHLTEYYQNNGILFSSYSYDGYAITNYESPSMYATSLAFMMFTDPDAAEKIYQEKIIALYSNEQNSFKEELPYYEQNILWFGSALYNKQLVKL